MPGGLVVFSPHLDDAVLSLGADIAERVRAGEPVAVWTAFTAAPPPGTVPRGLRRFADYSARIAEDGRALALLGAGSRRLDLPERVWRTPPARGLGAAFRTPPDAAGFEQLARLEEVAGEALERPGTRVLAPLGIGHHVDHLEVAVAVLRAALRQGATDRVGFYEDFYALSNGARRRHPVTGADAGSLWRRVLDAPGWAGLLEGLVLGVTPFVGSGPSLDAYVPGASALVWTSERRPAGPWARERQLAALAEYHSQTPALGGMRRLSRILGRAQRVRGGSIIWSAQPG